MTVRKDRAAGLFGTALADLKVCGAMHRKRESVGAHAVSGRASRRPGRNTRDPLECPAESGFRVVSKGVCQFR
jgi:hypothetical protein